VLRFLISGTISVESRDERKEETRIGDKEKFI
jgi:hypothetical protein